MDPTNLINNINYDFKESVINLGSFKFKVFGHPNELLYTHMKRTFNIFKKLSDKKILHSFYSIFSKKEYLTISEQEFNSFIKLAIYFHDIGKISFNFQTIRMTNNVNSNHRLNIKEQKEILKKYFSKEDYEYIESEFDCNHSLNSALIFLKYLNKNVELKKNLPLILFVYMIYGHHTKIKDINVDDLKLNNDCVILSTYVFNENIKNKLEFKKLRDDFQDITRSNFKKLKNNCLKRKDSDIFSNFYSYMYSLLISSDVIASSYSDIPIEEDLTFNNNIINNKLLKKMNNKFNSSNIRKQNSENILPINKLRNEMLVESEKNLNKYLNENIKLFKLNIPTGGGKTLTSMNLALNILNKTEVNKVIYAMPFINILDQNYEVLKEEFGLEENEEIRKIYSNSETIINEENEEIKNSIISEIILNDLLFNYPVICTTFVTLFNKIIKNNKKTKYAFSSLENSVIILDEIQSLPINNWTSLYYLINSISEQFNIYFIFMSATLPAFNKLKVKNEIINELNYKELISKPSKYYENKIFSDRNEICGPITSLKLEDEEKLKDYYLNIIFKNFKLGYKTCLIVLNTIKSSRKIYEILEEYKKCYDFDIELLNSTILNYNKNRIIKKINSNKDKHLILISTQSIEAGVDISFDFVFRDFVTLDSIEQVKGRCNRNNSLKINGKVSKGLVYITDISSNDKPTYKYVYINDLETRIKATKKLLIEDKKLNYNYNDINSYYDNISNRINDILDEKESSEQFNDYDNIDRWNEIKYSKIQEADGIHIIEPKKEEEKSFFIETNIDSHYFTNDELNYVKKLEKKSGLIIIKDNKIIGRSIYKYYNNNIILTKDINKRKVLKKEFASIFDKFLINTIIKKDLEKNMKKTQLNEYLNNPIVLINEEFIGDQNNLYSIKYGLNTNFEPKLKKFI